MKHLLISMTVMALSGCDSLRDFAPYTVAGYETGGVLGALDGASGAVLARCRTLDGAEFRVAVDDTAVLTGTGDLVERVRSARENACTTAASAAFLMEVATQAPDPDGSTAETPVFIP